MILFMFSILSFLAFLSAAAAADQMPQRIPQIRYADLANSRRGAEKRLQKILQVQGAVVVSDVPELDSIVSNAFGQIGDCFSKPHLMTGPEMGPVQSHLSEGVERWTLATQTDGGSPQPLPPWTQKSCPDLMRPASNLRNRVGEVLQRVARAVDTATGGEQGFGGDRKKSLEDLVVRGLRLEQFHRYSTSDGFNSSADAMEMHTDAGVMQALVVRWRPKSAQDFDSNSASGLRIDLPGGSSAMLEETSLLQLATQPADKAKSGILFLVGQGAEDWLPHLGFRAAPHSVSLSSRSVAERLVYGVMVLPPTDFPVGGSSVNVTFGEWWQKTQSAVAARETPDGSRLQDWDNIALGCLSTQVLSRRLRDIAGTCPQGQTYCWMQCSAGPETCENSAVCLTKDLDPCDPYSQNHHFECAPRCPPTSDLLFEVRSAGEGALNGIYKYDSDVDGKKSYRIQGGDAVVLWKESDKRWILLNSKASTEVQYFNQAPSRVPPTGLWDTYLADPPPPRLSYEISPGLSSSSSGPRSKTSFCSGLVTSMHMGGFVWNDSEEPCLVLLFREWELSSAAKFWIGVVGTFFAGIFAELLVAGRRWEAKSNSDGHWTGRLHQIRGTPRLVLYAVTRCFGYFIMLIAMTYSVEMFLALLLGLTVGHGFFNMKATVDEDLSPCCAASDATKIPETKSSRTYADTSPERTRPLVVEVRGMTCESCENTVRDAVALVPGVVRVLEVSAETGTLNLQVAHTAEDVDVFGRLQNALSESGFSVLSSVAVNSGSSYL